MQRLSATVFRGKLVLFEYFCYALASNSFFSIFHNSWFVHKSCPLWYKNWLFCCLYLPALLAENISLGYSHTKYLIKVTTASFYRLCRAPRVCSPPPIAHTSEWIFPLHLSTPLQPQRPAFHTAIPERKNYVNKDSGASRKCDKFTKRSTKRGSFGGSFHWCKLDYRSCTELVWVRYDYDVNSTTIFRMKVHNESSLALVAEAFGQLFRWLQTLFGLFIQWMMLPKRIHIKFP